MPIQAGQLLYDHCCPIGLQVTGKGAISLLDMHELSGIPGLLSPKRIRVLSEGACPAFTDSYLSGALVKTKSGTEHLYPRKRLTSFSFSNVPITFVPAATRRILSQLRLLSTRCGQFYNSIDVLSQ